jgi:hypothetical protein
MSLNKITGANRNSVRTSLDNAQPAVGGDVNPIIDFVNNISSESTSVNTVTSASAAVTLNAISGTITTEGLTTAADTTATLTVTNAYCTTASTVLCTIAGGTSTTGAQVLIKVVPSNGSFVISFRNVHASAALNGTLIFKFIIL